MMKPQVTVDAYVERIQGSLAVISLGGRQRPSHPANLFSPVREKKYLILLRRFMPEAAREGASLSLLLTRAVIRRASADLEKTLQNARLCNEVIAYMR
jgi:hypothetical protein